MKGWIKKLAAIIAISLTLCASTACTVSTDLEMIGKPTMTVRGIDEETGMYIVVVEGLAKNVSGELCDYASVSVDFFDELGDPIGGSYGYRTIEYIDVDEVWHYYIIDKVEVVPADFEVSGYTRNW